MGTGSMKWNETLCSHNSVGSTGLKYWPFPAQEAVGEGVQRPGEKQNSARRASESPTRRVQALAVEARRGTSLSAQLQVAAQQQESASTQKAEREVSHMVVVMVGSFCLCYVPYAALAMYMVNNRNHGLDLRLVTIPAFFSKSSCVYNPIIYCFMNKQVKLSTFPQGPGPLDPGSSSVGDLYLRT